MPAPHDPTPREKLAVALHLYSLARRPIEGDERADDLRALARGEVTDHYLGRREGVAFRRFLGLTKLSQRAPGTNVYLAAIRRIADGYETEGLPSAIQNATEGARMPRYGERRVAAVLVATMTDDDLWCDCISDLLAAAVRDAPEDDPWSDLVADFVGARLDADALDMLARAAGFDVDTELPREILHGPDAVPLRLPRERERPTEKRCRRCGRVKPIDEFRHRIERERRDTDAEPRPVSECLPCEAVRQAERRAADPDLWARYAADRRDRIKTRNLSLAEKARLGSVTPERKRCYSCGVTFSDPRREFTIDISSPDALASRCKKCSARDAARRRLETS